MPIRLSDLSRDERTYTLSIGEEQAEVVYRPSAYTPELEMSVLASADNTDLLGKPLAEFISELLIRWEIVDDSGEEIPPTLENLMKFPVPFLVQVLESIGNDMRTEGDTRKNSAAGSRKRATLAKHRTGIP